MTVRRAERALNDHDGAAGLAIGANDGHGVLSIARALQSR